MRHRKGCRKLSKPTDQRVALLRSIIKSLFKHGRIRVTVPRAKEAKKMAEKVIAISRGNNLPSRRKIEAILGDRKLVSQICAAFPDRFEGRPGGFTRIVRAGFRAGDAAPMAILELL